MFYERRVTASCLLDAPSVQVALRRVVFWLREAIAKEE
jgi:hypothetical protein